MNFERKTSPDGTEASGTAPLPALSPLMTYAAPVIARSCHEINRAAMSSVYVDHDGVKVTSIPVESMYLDPDPIVQRFGQVTPIPLDPWLVEQDLKKAEIATFDAKDQTPPGQLPNKREDQP